MIPGNIVQAARGPLMLIALGALIAIDYNTHFKFNQTWPVLIILFGILKLMERTVGPPPAPYTSPAPDQGTGFQPPPPPQDQGGTPS